MEVQLGAEETGVGEHLVLAMISEVGPLSQQMLSDHLRIDRTVMVGLVDSLEANGYAVRGRHPVDRRAYQITITDTGRRALAEMDHRIPVAIDESFAVLTKKERKELCRLLHKLVITGG
jgi:DNA-binding MarR family transcriptional regulator